MWPLFPTLVYTLCFLTSATCAVLLGRTFVRSRARMLFWSAACFTLLALNNLFVVFDLILLPSTDLAPYRTATSLGAVATLLYVDSFGNIALNVTRDDVERIGIVSGTRVELELAGERYYAIMARTFADARPGDVILYEDSYRNMSVAISRGSAARMLHAAPGQTIRISTAL